MNLLLEAQAEVDSKDNQYEFTPLSRAAANGHSEVVILLLDAHAEVGAKDKSGNTVLHRARERGHRDVVELLEKRIGITETAFDDNHR